MKLQGAESRITRSRCTGCGKIGDPGQRVHSCYVVRDRWGQHSSDHYEPTELVDFAVVEGSARPHDG